jgi:hypothetical protein
VMVGLSVALFKALRAEAVPVILAEPAPGQARPSEPVIGAR